MKSGYILIADDRIVEAQNDTLIELPAYIDFYIRRKTKASDKFYQDLRDRMFRYRWSKELHNIILTTPSEKKYTGDTLQTQKGEIEFLPFKGLIIRNIYLNRLDVFGPSVIDPERKTSSILGKAGNKVHFKTRIWVITNNLLFEKGDSIDPYVLADNERIYRQLPFIEDARIVIKNINETSDSADVEIITKDKWSIGVDFATADLKSLSVNLWEDNIFGTGHEFQNEFYRRDQRLPSHGIKGSYSINNIGGSFINARVGYNAIGNKDYSFHLWRDFYTQRTKLAGSFYYEDIHQNYRWINDMASSNNAYYDTISGNIFNFWIGRALSLGNVSITSTSISNIAFSGGIFSNKYFQRPPVSKNYRYEYQNKTYYLASLAFSAQGHYKTNLVFNYGRTEDIPYGLLLKITHGIEVNEFSKRLYNAVSFSKGNYIGNLGYFFGKVSLSGFLNENKFEQGMLNLSANMFTNLLVAGQLKFRNFLSTNYIKGFHRNDDEYLYLNNLDGVRGFRSDSVRGGHKFTLNFETVCFTPYYLAGFRFAVFAFADFGFVGPSNASVFKNNLYNGFGAGFRFRNERLVFKTFQIRLAYYPWLPKHAQGDLFTISTESRFMPASFRISAPEISQFK